MASSKPAPLPALPGPEEPPLPPFPGRLTDVGAYQLNLRRTGAGRGVGKAAERAVYVHGLAGSSLNWTDLMHLLAPRLPGVALDLPGFGLSPAPPDHDYSLQSHTNAVVSLIEAEGGRPVHLFGNSLGGVVSLRVAEQRPELVRTLTLISPALPMYRVKLTNVHMPLMLLPGMPGVMFRLPPASSPQARADLFIGLCWGDPSSMHPDRRAEWVDEMRRREEFDHTDRAYVDSLRGLATGFVPGRNNVWRTVASTTTPALAVFGRKDRLIDWRTSARAEGTFPDARIVVFNDLGHVAQMEAPTRVAALVLDRIAEVAARRARPPAGGSAVSARG